MRRFASFTAVVLGTAALSAGVAGASTVPTSDPADAPAAELSPVDDTIAVDPDLLSTVIVDSTGSPLARVSVLAVDPDWVDYGEWDSPRAGYQYVRVTVVVESLSPRGLFEIDDDDFALQDADGFLFAGDVVATAAQDAADEDVVDEAELAGGESVQLEVTFRVVSGVVPDTLYYFPSYDRLVTIAQLS